MNLSQGFIGLFDSGVGGLSVIKALKKRLPAENFIYVGDTLKVPYGPKPRYRVQSLSYRLIGYLLGRGAKLIVVACNTATVAIFPEAKEDFKVPVVGPVEAGAKEAYNRSREKRIGLIATEGTIKSGVYQKVLQEIDPEVSIITQAAPGLVEAVEKGELNSPKTSQLVEHYLQVFRNKIDTLILGCTHLPFLKGVIEQHLEGEVQIVDPAERLAEEVATILEQQQALNKNVTGSYELWVTDASKLNSVFWEKAREELDIAELQFQQLKL